MSNIAVILAGCGHQDGAEIREAIISLLALDEAHAQVTIFAPDTNQFDIVNHLTGESVSEKRNIMIEAARIARGEVEPLSSLNASNFDGLALPGGFGAAKNFSNFIEDNVNFTIDHDYEKALLDFYKSKKPIAAMCISPVLVVRVLKLYDSNIIPTVTIGSDTNNMIKNLGGINRSVKANEIAIDEKNNLITTPAYMLDAPFREIAQGIKALITELIRRI